MMMMIIMIKYKVVQTSHHEKYHQRKGKGKVPCSRLVRSSGSEGITQPDQSLFVVLHTNRIMNNAIIIDSRPRTSAPLAAWTMSGTATTFSGSFRPGRYLTFSWVVLMISVSFFLSTISSNTHMLTVGSNMLGLAAALAPTSRDMAEPQLPEPTMQTRLGDMVLNLQEEKGN